MIIRSLVVIVLLFSVQFAKAQIKFQSPLQGVAGQDYWIVNYMDHDLTMGLSDIECGNKTYDGHTGTDFLLRSFKTMDSGVVVYAVADGIVFKTKDSLFDRSKVKNTGGFGNYIAINHSNQLYTYYAHLKKFSLLVKVGDTVKAGQPIGQVASSGNTTDPHLHFEVYDNASNLIDPFSGSCQTATPSLWVSQPAYDTSFKVIDIGFTPYVPNLDTLRERYNVRDTFYADVDTAVNFWIQTQGLRQGQVVTTEWYTPTNILWFTFNYNQPADYWYSYFWTYINTPPDSLSGVWTAKFYVNNTLRATKDFHLQKSLSVHNVYTSRTAWSIVPNPSIDRMTILGGHKNKPVSIYNISGQLIKSLPYLNQDIDVSFLPKGVYIIKHDNAVQKMIKQ